MEKFLAHMPDRAAGRHKNPLFFSLARWICLVVATLGLLAAIVQAVQILGSFGSGSFDTPKFSDKRIQRQIVQSLPEDSVKVQQEQIDITKRYAQQILEVVKKHGIVGENSTAEISAHLLTIPENRRDDYIEGWIVFMDDGMEELKKQGRLETPEEAVKTNSRRGMFGFGSRSSGKLNANQLSEMYYTHFVQALEAQSMAKSQQESERTTLLYQLLGTLTLFVLAMIVPVLIAIEKNTRQASVASPVAPAPAASLAPTVAAETTPSATTATPSSAPAPAAANCPHCQAAIVPGDAFCGECGAKLG